MARGSWTIIDADGDDRPWCSDESSAPHRAAVAVLDYENGTFTPLCLTHAGVSRKLRKRVHANRSARAADRRRWGNAD